MMLCVRAPCTVSYVMLIITQLDMPEPTLNFLWPVDCVLHPQVGSSSTKAQAIRDANITRQRKDALTAQAAAWQKVAAGAIAWCDAGAPLKEVCARALDPVRDFLNARDGLQPELKQVCGKAVLVTMCTWWWPAGFRSGTSQPKEMIGAEGQSQFVL